VQNLPFTYASFATFLAQKKLMGARCQACGTLSLPPRAICPNCHADRMEWVEMPERGTLAAFTSIYVGQSALLAEGYDRSNPYCAGIVELENGLRVSARILGVDPRNPAGIRIGSPMILEILDRKVEGDSLPILAFRVL